MTGGSQARRRGVAHGQRWGFGLLALPLGLFLSLGPAPAEKPPEGRSVQQALAARAAPELAAQVNALAR